jgi:hypothetical protein
MAAVHRCGLASNKEYLNCHCDFFKMCVYRSSRESSLGGDRGSFRECTPHIRPWSPGHHASCVYVYVYLFAGKEVFAAADLLGEAALLY